MSMLVKISLAVLLFVPGFVLWGNSGELEAQRPKGAVSAEAVARTRKTVKMLDDVYKTAVVLITFPDVVSSRRVKIARTQ